MVLSMVRTRVILLLLALTVSGLLSIHLTSIDHSAGSIGMQDVTFSTMTGPATLAVCMARKMTDAGTTSIILELVQITHGQYFFVFMMGTVVTEKRENLVIRLRDRVLSVIENNPGIHLRELQRMVNCAMGALQYHLNRLERDGLVQSLKIGNTRHLFATSFSGDEQMLRLTALARNPTVNAILHECLTHERVTQVALSKNLLLDKSLVAYYINSLVEANVLRVIPAFGRERPLMFTAWASSALSSLGV